MKRYFQDEYSDEKILSFLGAFGQISKSAEYGAKIIDIVCGDSYNGRTP